MTTGAEAESRCLILSPETSLFQLKDVSKTFASADGTQLTALERISCEIRDGEFVCLLGPSGCGKSTLLNILVGLERESSGEVLIKGKPAHEVPMNGWAGYMTQQDALMSWRTVYENIEIGPELRGVDKAERRRIADRYLKRFKLEDFGSKYISELSGGMRKRVSLARTLAYAPKVLFLDEPFGALDIQTREFLQDDLMRIWEDTHKTVVFVTHDVMEALRLSTRIIMLSRRPGNVKAVYETVGRHEDLGLFAEIKALLKEELTELDEADRSH